uniref:Uncharacterized protein n=1 Tax=Daphnia galeata TaxID=27404 RepID=A0A8J2WNW6_9CRUS|nr:unnamed protein product [Daphnia galeata]
MMTKTVHLLRHFAAYKNQKQDLSQHLTNLLKLLKLYEPIPNYCLLRSTGTELVHIDDNDWHTASREILISRKLTSPFQINYGKYVHFGLKNALSGNYAGLVHCESDLLQFVYNYTLPILMQALDVNSTTEKAKAILRGERAVQSADNTLTKPIPHFDVDISIDEAKLNEETTAATITPILGRIHSIQPNDKSADENIILLNTSVFINGLFVGKGSLLILKLFLKLLFVNCVDCLLQMKI